MKNKKASLQDIANLAGVTKMTISRYFRTPEKVSQKNKDKIAKALDEIQYIPNLAPQIMLGEQSHCIGVVVPSLSNLIFLDVLCGIESVASKYGYQTIITNYNYDNKKEEKEIMSLLAYNVDAIILSKKDHSRQAVKYLKAADIPTVELLDITENCFDIQVGFNNEQASFDMTEVMIKSGKKNIIYINSELSKRDMLRSKGFVSAMNQYNLIPKQFTVPPESQSSITLGRKIFKEIIEQYPDVDGIFCSNDDLVATGVLLECKQQNIVVPDQIAIAGFHGLDIVRDIESQKLASVITPRFDIGKVATETLINKLEGRFYQKNIDLGYKIDIGGTV